MVFVREDLRDLFGEKTIDEFFAIEGKVYRDHAHRKTQRFERGERAFFIKKHDRAGWGEVVGQALKTMKAPQLGARYEWEAVEAFEKLGIPTVKVAAYGESDGNAASQRSFVLTEELDGVTSLEDLCRHWSRDGVDEDFKRQVINRVSDLTRRMHEGGINHRDLYLCHYLLKYDQADSGSMEDSMRLFIFDLHRAQMRESVPMRWLVKDVGGLLFSAMDVELTTRDLLRFVKQYGGGRLRQTLHHRRAFWQKVLRRARRLYRKEHGRPAPQIWR